MAKTPDTPSRDYEAMLPYWEKIEAILGGAEAMRDAGGTAATSINPYLPKFSEERWKRYRERRQFCKFTNIFGDIVSGLAAKPFSKKVDLVDKEDVSPSYAKLVEDVDGRGNNLHVFAAETFYHGIAYAVDWVLVEYTRARPRPDGRPLTLEDQGPKGQNLKPYWVRIPATRMLAVESNTVRGREIFTHARIKETVTRRIGFEEEVIERVRVLNREPIEDGLGRVIDYAPATWELWEQQSGRRGKTTWERIDGGEITIGEIALVPFSAGRRLGASWTWAPPMRDAADLQIEHFQEESALKHIKHLTAFPMLAGNGIEPALDAAGDPKPVEIGPQAVLYARPIIGETSVTHGEWKFIEPTAESLKFLADQVEETERQLRELGRQPLTASAGITVVQAAMASQKASSAAQAWAWALKDALEQALRFTALWLKEDPAAAPAVFVHTDFAIETADEQGPPALIEARKNGDLSRRTLWGELQRRAILSRDFDAEAEEKALEEEAPDLDDEAEKEAALGGGQRAAA